MLYRTEVRLLPVIAGFWTRSQTSGDYEELIRLLCDRILDPALLRRMLAGTAGDELQAGLQYLVSHNNSETVEAFEPFFGHMRVAGTEKILREKYWKEPVSATEKLIYRGLIFRENRMIADQPVECYILPDDLGKLLKPMLPAGDQPVPEQAEPLIVRPAAPSETAAAAPVFTQLPDLFTVAAALKRSSRTVTYPGLEPEEACSAFIAMLLYESGMFPADSGNDPEKIRRFLVQNRTAARISLTRFWRDSARYDELSEDTEHFSVKSSPVFDRRGPRNTILRLLEDLPEDTWWSLSGFTAAVKKARPQFFRESFTQAGGIILDPEGNDLSGIGSWFQLEGAYIQFLLFGPLYWLGITQTAYTDKTRKEPTAFRISKDGRFILLESAHAETSQAILDKPNLEQAAPVISSDGSVTCSSKVPRYFRYMAGRCCEVEKIKGDTYIFRITPNSLAAAEKAGITKEVFLSVLRRFSKRSLPPSLEHMLASGEKTVLPATIFNAVILTVPQQDILEELLETSRLEKWILQQINKNSLMIDPKGIDEIRRFLMEKEIFVDIQK